MIRFALLLFLIVYPLQANAFQQPTISIIPQPAEMVLPKGQFVLPGTFDIQINNSALFSEASYLSNMLFVTNWKRAEIKVSSSIAEDAVIQLKLERLASFSHPEAYQLSVNENGITISAPSKEGLFYGIQTLRQLLPIEIEKRDPSLVHRNTIWAIPFVEINDFPRFEYRGMHLDVARHFFPIDFVKKYIDLMAMYKYNRFHWHLTEDQGWRIEIKQYPKLTEIGGWRDSTLIGNYGSNKYDGITYGGYYTQDEIKEVVAYAQLRHITIIPEIEMPGHSTAAIAAYPELGCFNQKIDVATTWGVFEDIYCPKEETFEFLENVLDEAMELFPSTYIHIGGDEAPKKQWEESEIAQQIIKQNNLADEHELQSYFITRIERYLNAHGRQIIGWDEILEGGLAPQATVMSWRGEQGGIDAAKMGHSVIMTPNDTNYFDHYQSDSDAEPIAICCLTTLEDVYAYEPVPETLSPQEASYILGSQGNVWTEYIHTGAKVEYMTFPRAMALSEVLWSPKASKNWGQFNIRLQPHFIRMDHLQVNIAEHYRE